MFVTSVVLNVLLQMNNLADLNHVACLLSNYICTRLELSALNNTKILGE